MLSFYATRSMGADPQRTVLTIRYTTPHTTRGSGSVVQRVAAQCMYDGRLFLLLVGFFLYASLDAQETVPLEIHGRSCVNIEKIAALETEIITTPAMHQMLSCAVEREQTVFELFHDIALTLTEHDTRAVIAGATLRALDDIFIYGYKREHHLLPIALIDRIEIGAPHLERPQLEITLHDTPPAHTEQVNWVGAVDSLIDTSYGCAVALANEYQQCFGITASTPFYTGPVHTIELYEKNKIAIYVKNLFIPKRWGLYPVAHR